MIRRGEIFYINPSAVCSTEYEQKGRPAIIVSNNKCNTFSNRVEVVYLTTQEKTDLPTHVTIRSSSKLSTALCEQIHTVMNDRIGEYVGICTDEEMYAVDKALCVSLGIDFTEQMDNTDEPVKSLTPPSERSPDEALYDGLRDDLLKTRTERDLYKTLYEQILRMVTKNENL